MHITYRYHHKSFCPDDSLFSPAWEGKFIPKETLQETFAGDLLSRHCYVQNVFFLRTLAFDPYGRVIE
jgi:hypothetical protein